MEKFCIFCGNSPKGKTKEHVIPRWLIEFTGDPKRVVPVGYNYQAMKEIKFSFDQLTFPACDNCNRKYSSLEGDTKPIIEKILLRKETTKKEIITLLEWFDKVRIGIWLGQQYLSGESIGVEPHFHINTRISKKDRVLIINRCNDESKRLTIIGVNTLLFYYYPRVFTIIINDFVFTSISTDFLISHHIGFPFPKQGYIHNDYNVEFIIENGTQRLKAPIFRYPLVKPSLIIAQPIVPKPFVSLDYYNYDYYRQNCIDAEEGTGDIFIEENYTLKKMSETISFDFPTLNTMRNKIRPDQQTFLLQLETYKNKNISDQKLKIEYKENYRSLEKAVLKIQNQIISKL